MIYEKEMKEI